MSKKKEKAPKPEAAPDGAEGAEGAEGAPAKKKLPMMLIIGGVAGLLVLGGGGGAAYFLVLKPKPKKEEKKGKEGEAAAKPPGPNDPEITDGPDGVVYYKAPPLTVNMQSASPGGKAPLLQLKLTFEAPDHETTDAMKEGQPRMNDMLQGFLSELRQKDLDGSLGRVQLRMEILRRANLILAPHKINAVNIEGMLVS